MQNVAKQGKLPDASVAINPGSVDDIKDNCKSMMTLIMGLKLENQDLSKNTSV